jgi:hypothetical protein
VTVLAVIAKDAGNPAAARAPIGFLQGPAIDAALKENGMSKSTINLRLNWVDSVAKRAGVTEKAPYERKSGDFSGCEPCARARSATHGVLSQFYWAD